MKEEILQWFKDSPWLNPIFLLLAILSIIVSILFTKSKKKSPVFDIRSTNIISEKIKKIEDIEVKFQGEKIENLTVTKLAFWNRGNDTLNELDQAPTDKLRIELDAEYQILDCELLFQSNIANNTRYEKKANTIKITFDYFDGNQGAIIKFIHTGKKSSNANILGTFKGSDVLKKINTQFSYIEFALMVALPFFGAVLGYAKGKKVISWIILLSGIGMISTAFFRERTPVDITYLVLGILYLILGIKMAFRRSGLPEGFGFFYDDK